MTTAYTPILKLALPVTGELNGTWGDVVNNNITSMVEQAVAGLATVNTWTANSHTLTTADGTTSESRCAMLVIDDDGAGNPSAAATVVCPTATKSYIVRNLCGQTVTVKTSAGTGVAVPNNQAALVFCDGTNVVTGAFNGDVVGPATATNNAIVTFDGTTGKLIKDNSGATISAGVITATGFSGPLNGSVGATTPSTVVATQVDITAQGDLRLQDTTGGEYVALQAPATIATSYTLTLPVDDGTSGQALITDGSGVLSWSTAASGDVYGPASATDNAVARYDGTTGKIIQNSAVTIGDDGATVIAANSASDGLRITQIGAGNALVVEDSANPDASPFVINASGNVVSGSTVSLTDGSIQTFKLDGFGANDFVRKNTAGSGIVLSEETIGNLRFNGFDGTSYVRTAQIFSAVDGTPGTNDMPGRLVFSTTADGASSPTERMRIDSTGGVGIGTTSVTDRNLGIGKNITGATSAYGVVNNGQIQSGVTTLSQYYRTTASTAAAAFTLTTLDHFSANQGTIGATSAVTTQVGFNAASSLTGATNNYGFYGNIASGTGRWNFYAAGTADNYFAGALGLGSVPIAGVVPLNIGYTLTGGTSVVNVRAIPTILSDVTSSAAIFRTQVYVQAAAFTLGSLIHYDATLAAIGSTAAIANQYGFNAAASLIGATNNFGFYGGIASGTGRYNFYAAGTAANVFVGTTSIGGTVGSESLRVTPVASAVNYVEILGGATSGAARISARGSDTNIPIVYSSKGNREHAFYTNGDSFVQQFNISHTASAVNYFQVTGGDGTTTSPRFSAQGSSTDVTMQLVSKGSGQIQFFTNVIDRQFNITPVASSVNYLQVAGNVAGSGPTFSSQGSDTNINMVYQTKGTGAHAFYTGSAPQFVIQNTTSAVNYLSAFGNTVGNGPYLQASGSDTNISFLYSTKGTGEHVFYTAGNSFTRQFTIAHTASAVNYLQVTGATTGNSPNLSAEGSDTNINFIIKSKGTAVTGIYGNQVWLANLAGERQFVVTNTASAVNYLQVTGGTTGNAATLSAQGSDAGVSMAYTSKGTGQHIFSTGGGTQLIIDHTASSVNYLQPTGAATGSSPVIYAAGSDANLNIKLVPKGTGVLQYGTYTAGIIAQAGYITIADAGGTTRRLLVG